MKETKREIMEGVEGIGARKIALNTVEYTDTEGNKVIRLHHTNIVTHKVNGDIVLNSGGWRTVTTKSRINKYSPGGWRIEQKKRVWYLTAPTLDNGAGMGKREYPFTDGITIHPDGSMTGEGPDPKATLKLKARIKKYVEGFTGALIAHEIPQPSGGDCWACLMKNDKGETVMGNGHIFNHLDEKYYVPSLLLNALEEFGASQVMRSQVRYYMGYHKENSDRLEGYVNKQIAKCLTRYLYRRVGLAA